MPSRKLDFPVFDADNHMYETTEAFTKYLPAEYDGPHQVRRGRRPDQDRRQRTRSATTSPTRPSRWSPRPAPRRSTSRAATPRASPAGRSWASAFDALPGFFDPEPRLELMDELGIDRALMWPTLASLLEERIRDDPPADHAVVHALNQWMHEHWTFNYENRIFPTPVIHLRHRRPGDRGADWVLERGARIILIRPAPAGRLPGPAVAGPARVRPVLEAGGRSRHPGRACTPPTAATSGTPTSGRAPATAR